MNHDEAKGLFSEYLEGELSEEKGEDLKKHLEGCEDCRKELEEFKKTVDVLSAFRVVQAPEDFESKVTSKLKRRSRRRDHDTSPLSHKVPFETICIIMLLILAAFYIMLYLLPQIDTDREFQQENKVQKKEKKTPRPKSRHRPLKARDNGWR